MKVYLHTSCKTEAVHTIISELDGVRTGRLVRKCITWAHPYKVRVRNGKIHIQGNHVKTLSTFVHQFNKEQTDMEEHEELEEQKQFLREMKDYAQACRTFASISHRKSKDGPTWNRIAKRAEDLIS